jgi:AraC-like DNA-binding protein
LFRFAYKHTDYRDFLQDLATALNTSIQDNRLVFPAAVASGYLELVVLPNGLQAMLVNYKANQEIYLQRLRGKEGFYTLRLDEVVIPDSLLIRIDHDYIKQPAHTRSAVFLTSSLFELSYLGTPGTSVRGLNIIMSRDWVARYMGLDTAENLLCKYLALKTASLNLEPMDNVYRTLVNEVLEMEKDDVLRLTKTENRVMQMVERFFNHLHAKMNDLHELHLTNEEIYRIMEVETLLVSNYGTPPPPIQELAKKVAVSPSKLKKQFKEVYGLPIFEYYQKNRMRKAKELLMSGELSVKEVGYEVGYANLSNFAVAFRKEFHLLPSDFVKHK